MKIKLPLLVTITILTLFAPSVKGEEQSSATNSTNVVLAEELVSLLHLDQGMGAAMDRMKQLQTKILASAATNASPETTAMVQKSMDASTAAAASALNMDRMKEMYVSTYATAYTAEELQGAIDFYKSPIGQRWVEKQPQVSMIIASKSMAMMPGIMDSVKKSMSALDALCKRTNSPITSILSPPSPAPSPATTN